MNGNTTISATLDLTQAIKNFEQTIAAQMSLTDVYQWDGQTVLSLEQSIRQAALILAGQCIALLLHKLSESKAAIMTPAKLSQGWRHPKSKENGRVKRQVPCVDNVVVCMRLPYVVERSNKARCLRRHLRGQGFCPFLRWLWC